MKRLTKPLIPTGYMGCILAMSSIPGNSEAGNPIHLGWLPSLLQNSLHIPQYGLLSALWYWALLDQTRKLSAHRGWIACLCMVFAALDEILQTSISGRYGSITDFGLDALGILAGLLVMPYFSKKMTS